MTTPNGPGGGGKGGGKSVKFNDEPGIELVPMDEDEIEARRGYRPPPENDGDDGVLFIIRVAVVVALVAWGTFGYFSRHRGNPGGGGGGGNLGEESPAADPEMGSEFGASSGHFRYAREILRGGADSGDEWTGAAAGCHGGRLALLGDLVGQASDTGQELKDVVATQAKQVNDGRETLENVLNGLGLAMPVAQTLWYSGPAGPALSYQFQLATSNSAIGTSADTMDEMHDNAQENAVRLDALAQKCSQLFELLSEMGGSS